MKLPSIYSVRRIGDRWWIEAYSEHLHRRELDCRLLRSSSYLSSESREDRVRDRVDRGFPQETVPFPPGNGHRFPQATVTVSPRQRLSGLPQQSHLDRPTGSALLYSED